MPKRIRVEFDPFPDLSYLEQDEFADTNPEDVVSYGLLLEEQCECCGTWIVKDSVGGCDIMADEAGDLTGTYEVREHREDEHSIPTFPEPLRWALDHFEL